MMKKVIMLLLTMMMTLSVAACNSKNDREALARAESTEQAARSETIENTVSFEPTETAAPATEADDFVKYGLENNLNENDISIVRNFYTQIAENYLTLQDGNTEQYTRNPIDIYKISIVYFGEKPIIGCHYMYLVSVNERYEFALAFEMDDKGNLTETDFDIDQYTSENVGEFGTTAGNVVITYAQIGGPTKGQTFPFEDADRIKYTMGMYANYKKLRQEKYGDMYENSESFQDKLDEVQTKLFNNILNTNEVWDYYYNRRNEKDDPCILIRIWSFDDGSAEILCTHGTVDFYNESTGGIQYSGSDHGYSISAEGASELDEQAQKRLENDLANANKLYWSPEWAENVKKEKLAEFIFNL